MGMAGGQNGSELMILMAMMTLILWVLIKIENSNISKDLNHQNSCDIHFISQV
jgi:hypothetical protein